MEGEHDISIRGFINAIQGRPYYGEELSADPEHVFQHLRGLQGKGISCRLRNYRWFPKDKDTKIITPEQAAEWLEKKITHNTAKGAIEFEIDHFVYYGKLGKEKHFIEIYAAYVKSITNQRIRLPGKVMKLEFLVTP